MILEFDSLSSCQDTFSMAHLWFVILQDITFKGIARGIVHTRFTNRETVMNYDILLKNIQKCTKHTISFEGNSSSFMISEAYSSSLKSLSLFNPN